MKPSYIHGVATRPLIGQTIGDFLDEIAARFPANEALVSVFEHRRFTYRDFLDETNRVAGALMALGLEKDERIGIWSTNCVEWVLLQFATAKIGAVLVTINPAYRTYELEFALRQSECQLLVAGEGFKEQDYVRMLRQLIPELADNHGELHAEKFPHLRQIIYLGNATQPGMTNWKDFLGSANQLEPATLAVRQASLEFDEVINI